LPPADSFAALAATVVALDYRQFSLLGRLCHIDTHEFLLSRQRAAGRRLMPKYVAPRLPPAASMPRCRRFSASRLPAAVADSAVCRAFRWLHY